MPEIEDDLRATTEDIAADAAELQEAEEHKARLPPDDPRLSGLSRKAERIARRLVPKTVAERELVDKGAESREPGARRPD